MNVKQAGDILSNLRVCESVCIQILRTIFKVQYIVRTSKGEH